MIKIRRVKDIGELRHQCDLFQITTAKSGTGADRKIRSSYASDIWCNFQPFSPTKEQITAERGDRYENHFYGMLTIPYDKVVYDREMQCLYDGIYYRMVNKTKYNEAFFFLECVCVGTKAT